MTKTRGTGLLMLWTDEFERPDVPQSAQWNKVRDSNPWTRRIRPSMRLDEGSPAVFRRIYPEEAP